MAGPNLLGRLAPGLCRSPCSAHRSAIALTRFAAGTAPFATDMRGAQCRNLGPHQNRLRDGLFRKTLQSRHPPKLALAPSTKNRTSSVPSPKRFSVNWHLFPTVLRFQAGHYPKLSLKADYLTLAYQEKGQPRRTTALSSGRAEVQLVSQPYSTAYLAVIACGK